MVSLAAEGNARWPRLMDAIGNTPLVRVPFPGVDAGRLVLLVKLEILNPTLSVKDRTALALVQHAERTGVLEPGGTIVASSSGNLATALAMIAAASGYKIVCVVDSKVPTATTSALRALGATLEDVGLSRDDESPQTKRIERAKELAATIPGAVNIDQYQDAAAQLAHLEGTGPEIWRQTYGRVDWLVGALSTGSHLCGTSSFLKAVKPEMQTIGVEPCGSVLFGGRPQPYLQVGAGIGFRPANFRPELVDVKIKVDDRTAFKEARLFARNTGILVGPSSGAVIAAVRQCSRQIGDNSVVVAILPDHGIKYVDTMCSDSWLHERGLVAVHDSDEVDDREE